MRFPDQQAERTAAYSRCARGGTRAKPPHRSPACLRCFGGPLQFGDARFNIVQLDSLKGAIKYTLGSPEPYIAGRTTEQEFLRATEYYQGWGYDYRLYAPIFRFAREQRIPVRALNVPSDLASAVAKVGIAGLSGQQRAYLPREIGPADEAYRNRLRTAFEAHKAPKPDAFDHFVEAQQVWDEGMAESAAAFLFGNPSRRIVILAGSGHVAYGDGIPKRLERRTNATYSIVLNSSDEVGPHMGDYLLLSKELELPAAGILGISLEEKDGNSRIRSLNPKGAGEKAGLKRGDVLVDIDGQKVNRIADMHLALWDKKPGDHVRVRVRRKGRFGMESEHSFEVELAAAVRS